MTGARLSALATSSGARATDAIVQPAALPAPRARAAVVAAVGAAIVVLALNGVDALSGIVPQGDDFTLSLMGPGAIRGWYASTYGWVARPFGMALTDAVNVSQHALGGHLAMILLAVRAAALATFLVALWRQFALPLAAAIVGTVLFSVTPTAFEAWTQMTSVHNQLAAPLAIAASGLYARAAWASGVREGSGARCLAIAAVAQLIAYATYEQALLAIPAFVGVLLVAGLVTRRLPLRTGLSVGAVAGALAVMWGLGLLVSGYVGARAAALPARQAGGVELRDALTGATRLWLGTVQHHIWRLVEMLRTGRVWWWDRNASGVIAATAALASAALGALAAARLARPLARVQEPRGLPRPALLVLAAVVAAWAAIVPVGFTVRGFPLVSRMYNLPAAYLSLAVACLLPAAARRAPRVTVAAVGAFALWNTVVLRRYMEESRAGTRLALAVARAAADVPAAEAVRGILVVAPDVYGTWNTGAVQSWSLRPAARLAWRRNPAGRLFFATSCEDAAPPTVRDETDRVTAARPAWGAVVVARAGGVITAPTLADGCR